MLIALTKLNVSLVLTSFYNLPDDIEEKVESNANLSDW